MMNRMQQRCLLLDRTPLAHLSKGGSEGTSSTPYTYLWERGRGSTVEVRELVATRCVQCIRCVEQTAPWDVGRERACGEVCWQGMATVVGKVHGGGSQQALLLRL